MEEEFQGEGEGKQSDQVKPVMSTRVMEVRV